MDIYQRGGGGVKGLPKVFVFHKFKGFQAYRLENPKDIQHIQKIPGHVQFGGGAFLTCVHIFDVFFKRASNPKLHLYDSG